MSVVYATSVVSCACHLHFSIICRDLNSHVTGMTLVDLPQCPTLAVNDAITKEFDLGTHCMALRVPFPSVA